MERIFPSPGQDILTLDGDAARRRHRIDRYTQLIAVDLAVERRAADAEELRGALDVPVGGVEG